MEYLISSLFFLGSFIPGIKEEVIEPIEDPLPIVVEVVIERESVTEEEVINYIKQFSEKYDVDPDLAMSIASCESDYYYKAKNPHSSAEGVFQMIDSTWEYTMKWMGLSTTTPKTEIPISIEAGVFLLSKEGTRHWLESRPNWIKKIAEMKSSK